MRGRERDGQQRGGRRCDNENRQKRHHRSGAQTFRRGRALDFLESLNVKRRTLEQQLESPNLLAARQVIAGELKAIELVINEFIQLFELHEGQEADLENLKGEPSTTADEEKVDTN